MTKKHLILLATAIGIAFLEGCASPDTGNRAWGDHDRDDNRPGYKSPDAFPLRRDSRDMNPM